MISRLKGVIAHGHDTKLPREDSDSATVGWGTRPSSKVKPFEEDPGDALTYGREDRPNPEKNPTPVYG